MGSPARLCVLKLRGTFVSICIDLPSICGRPRVVSPEQLKAAVQADKQWEEIDLKSKKIKHIFAYFILVLALFAVWLSINGINKTIDRTVSVDLYEGNERTCSTSSIKISGDLRKTLFSTSFVGTFAIEYYELSCRDGIEAKIEWHDNSYEDISFYQAGDFLQFDIQMIDIDEEMDSMMIVFNDGTIIVTPNHYISTGIWNKYKS